MNDDSDNGLDTRMDGKGNKDDKGNKGNDFTYAGQLKAMAEIDRRMKLDFRAAIESHYPQVGHETLLSVDQVLAGIEVLEASYATLKTLAKVLLRHGTVQAVTQAAITGVPVSTVLFALGEIDPERFGMDVPMTPTAEFTARVREALAELAAVWLTVSHEAEPDLLCRRLGWVWRAGLSYNSADQEPFVTLAFAEEMAALLVLAAQLENDQGLLPMWLMWDE